MPSASLPKPPSTLNHTVALLTFLTLAVYSVPTVQAQTPRVLVVGDSWAAFFWNNQSLRQMFDDHGFSSVEERGAVTAISGSTAADWTSPAELQKITDELAAYPTIDIVQLTLGGNDFLAGQPGGGWFVGIPDPVGLADRITGDIQTVIDHIFSIDPNLNIILSLYDYANFEESLSGAGAFLCLPIWNDLGQPDTTTLNSAIVDLGDRIQAGVGADPRVGVQAHWGLMQFVFGFPSATPPVAPGVLLPPGDATLPSPIESMFLQSDCIHLTETGYGAVAESLWWNSYEPIFVGSVFSDGFETGDTTAW